jgi:hypothetical protein
MTHYAAGHVSPAAFENSQRNIIRQQILHEREEAARLELEAEITRRLEAARNPAPKAVQNTTAEAASSPRQVDREPVK